MIAVKNLTKRYGDRLAVDHLSFTVEKGEICGLLGPNGAGKSTTMNMMTGYISATEGTAEIDGCDIFEDARAAKAKIGYLPEQPPVYPDMTPREYLLFVAQLKGQPRAERARLVDDAMQKTGVVEVADRLIKNLSKGYRQRVGLAGAILGGPPVIILDEPTVGLDPKQIIEIRTLIRELAKEHTVLLSSHILSEVAAVCDRVLILSHGKLVALDTPENLSRRAEGKNVLVVTAQGGEAAVRAALAGVAGAQEPELVPGGEAGTVTMRVGYAQGMDLRAAVSSALAGAGLPVLGLHNETLSLEDVFLELTDADEQAPQGQNDGPAAEPAGEGAADKPDAPGAEAAPQSAAAENEKKEEPHDAGDL